MGNIIIEYASLNVLNKQAFFSTLKLVFHLTWHLYACTLLFSNLKFAPLPPPLYESKT